ncbi:hypothetical protein LTR56_009133 [Elasticomyces elasticus]|nr:hypothetical protein LTR56_009133 [Elasticomyces elasticus]KAK3660630.1 hypothetical protein LTR22_007877 [Elasticomyces elasticus]KAK4915568.1 hypothetical protein LTR49_016291 [Elasticomyces elasticus]
MAATKTLASYKPQQNSRLLSLTPELRNSIYQCVFCVSDKDDMVFLTRSVPATKAISFTSPNESSMLGRIQTIAHYLGEVLWQLSGMTGLRTLRLVIYPRYAPAFGDWTLERFKNDCVCAMEGLPDLSFVQEFTISTTYTEDAFVSLVA